MSIANPYLFPPDLTTFPKALCFFLSLSIFLEMFLSVLGRRKKFLCVIILLSWSRCHKSHWTDLPFLLAHSLSPPLLPFHFSYTVWRPVAPSLPTLPQHHPAAFTLAEAGQVLIRWRTCALSRKNIKPLRCLKLPPTLLYFSTWRCFQLQRK